MRDWPTTLNTGHPWPFTAPAAPVSPQALVSAPTTGPSRKLASASCSPHPKGTRFPSKYSKCARWRPSRWLHTIRDPGPLGPPHSAQPRHTIHTHTRARARPGRARGQRAGQPSPPRRPGHSRPCRRARAKAAQNPQVCEGTRLGSVTAEGGRGKQGRESAVAPRKLRKRARRRKNHGASAGPGARRARSAAAAQRLREKPPAGPALRALPGRSGSRHGSQGVNPGKPKTPRKREGREREGAKKEPHSRLPRAQKRRRRGGRGSQGAQKVLPPAFRPPPHPNKAPLSGGGGGERRPQHHEAAN